MSLIVTTEAVVLKSMKYRETSKIVTLFTKKFGKISAIVKGARGSKSKYGSSLEPMSYVSVVLYKKEGRELQTVSQCDKMKSFRQLTEDIDKIAVGLSVVEVVTIVAHEEENPSLFKLLLDTLSAIDTTEKNAVNYFYNFQIHLTRILGFQPVFDKCISCDSEIFSKSVQLESILYHLARGGPLCRNCAHEPGNKMKLTIKVFRILERFSTGSALAGIQNIEIDPKSKIEIENFLWSYLKYHVTGFRTLKSRKVFSAVLGNV